MSFRLAELFVDITGRSGALNKTLSGVHSGLLGAAGVAGRAGQGIASALLAPLSSVQGAIAGALGVGAIGAGLFKAIEGAATLNETVNKTRQIFGDAAGQILGEADRMAESFGTVKTEYLDAAAGFGAVFKGVGKGADEAAKLGNQLARLAIDMAAFDNTSDAEAFGAIASALRGESDPIEKFRVFLTADAVAAEALRMGLAKTKNEITDVAKKTAIMSLITKQTADAQGTAAREAGGFSSQLKRLTGQASNAMAELGSSLMPIGDSLVGAFNGALGSLRGYLGEHQAAIAAWASRAGETFTAMGPTLSEWATTAGEWIQTVITKTNDLASALLSFATSEGVASLTGVIGPAFQWLGGVVSEVIDTITFTFRNFDDIMTVAALAVQEKLTNMGELFTWLMGAAGELLGWFSRNWREVLTDTFNAGYAIASNAMTNIKDLVAATWSFITNPAGGFHFEFTPMLEGFKSTIKELPEIAAPALTSLQGQIDEVLDRIGGREAERAKQKIREALALAKGTEEGGKAETVAQDKAPGSAKEKKSSFVGLEDLSRKLNEAAGGKDKQTAKLVGLQERSVNLQQDTVTELRKANRKPAGAVIGAG